MGFGFRKVARRTKVTSLFHFLAFQSQAVAQRIGSSRRNHNATFAQLMGSAGTARSATVLQGSSKNARKDRLATHQAKSILAQVRSVARLSALTSAKSIRSAHQRASVTAPYHRRVCRKRSTCFGRHPAFVWMFKWLYTLGQQKAKLFSAARHLSHQFFVCYHLKVSHSSSFNLPRT